MPQLQSIDEVVGVPEPLKEAVRILVEALTSEARSGMEKEQQIPREHRDVRRGAETVDAQRMSTSSCGYHRTGWNRQYRA